MTTRAAASVGNDGGTARAGGVGNGRALPGGGPTGAASRRLAAVPASLGPVAGRRYAPTGTEARASRRRLTVAGPEPTTKADHNGIRIEPTQSDDHPTKTQAADV